MIFQHSLSLSRSLFEIFPIQTVHTRTTSDVINVDELSKNWIFFHLVRSCWAYEEMNDNLKMHDWAQMWFCVSVFHLATLQKDMINYHYELMRVELSQIHANNDNIYILIYYIYKFYESGNPINAARFHATNIRSIYL